MHRHEPAARRGPVAHQCATRAWCGSPAVALSVAWLRTGAVDGDLRLLLRDEVIVDDERLEDLCERARSSLCDVEPAGDDGVEPCARERDVLCGRLGAGLALWRRRGAWL